MGAGFVAVQLVDIGFFSLSYVGIEKWRLNPALEGFTPIDLYFMPYTHSLAGSVAWAVGAGVIAALVSPAGRRALNAVIIGALVLSHWLLDLIVHRPDLPLVHDHEEKLGFGLWDHPALVVPLELGLLFAGFALFIRATKPKGLLGQVMPWLLLSLLLAVQAFNWFTPPESDPALFSILGLSVYLTFAALAWTTDRTRT